ncbi:MAG: DUF2867 domain-containing protein [Nocardioides sp.]
MRLPNAVHETGPWRIHAITRDFVLEDAWALPVSGSAEDFQVFLDQLLDSDPAQSLSLPARTLWQIREVLGRALRLGRISVPTDRDDTAGRLPIPGTGETSLTERLPLDLRGTAADVDFGTVPFEPLYRTDVELAAEMSNRTVHGVLHLAWVDRGDGQYDGRMAVYVKPRGPLGSAYMQFIKPFRHWIVYPALLRQIERAWAERTVST